MKIAAYKSTNSIQRQISFGDDCGYVPNQFKSQHAMEKMSKEGYIIRGINTKDAFERLYADVDGVLKQTADRPDTITIEQFKQGTVKANSNTKYMVGKWEMAKAEFSNMMTSFWNASKNKINSKNVVADFLTQSEGLSKPNFFQRLGSKYEKYILKEGVIENVVKFFLKDGKHML